MSKTLVKGISKEINIVLFFLLLLGSIIANSFMARMNLESSRNSNQILISSLKGENPPFSPYQGNIRFEEDNSTIEDGKTSYLIEQGTQFELRTSQSKEIITPYETNVSLRSRIVNSSFKIYSSPNNDSNEWKNDIEPDYGDVNVTKYFTTEKNFFRLNFTENNQTPASGVTNIKFNVTSNPDPINFSTLISFDFCIPTLTNELLSSPHTLALEFRFNNGSIHFILSDFGSILGQELEENITKPDGSNSLYILCNETAPMNWRHISYNITRLITTYFSPEEHNKFTNLETLFCYMFAFIPNYQLSLDLDKLDYLVTLSPNSSIEYKIEENNFFSTNGTFNYDFILGNFTFSAENTSPWNESLITFISVNLTRKMVLFEEPKLETWNQSFVNIHINFSIPILLKNASFSFIYAILPSDWINLSIINQSVNFELLNETYFLNSYILGRKYRLNVIGLDWGILEAYGPNYFSNVTSPTDINRDGVIKVRGDLRFPLPGNIDLYLTNNSFIFHQSTVVMINSTFFFPEIEVTSQFPSGILELTLNWSNYGEFGFYKKLIYIHDDLSSESIIIFHSPQSIELYQFDTFFLNLSLFLNGEKYKSNTTLVFLIKGDISLVLLQTSSYSFFLNITHVTWDPGNYSIDVIASDEGKFYAKDVLQLTILAASIFWKFENLNTKLLEYENISFRLYSYIFPQGGGVYYILPSLNIKIWINDSQIIDCTTNSGGYVDISFDISNFIIENVLSVTIGGIIDEKVFILQNLLFYVEYNSTIDYRERATIQEIARSDIIANNSFYIYYNVEYSSNDSEWYVPIGSYSDFLIAAFILRNNYIVSTQTDHQYLIWTIEANQTTTDTLVIQLPCPIAVTTPEKISTRFRLKIDVHSDIIVNNYSIMIDLHYLGVSFSNLGLYDFLGRKINDIHFTIKDSIVTIFGLNIIDNVIVNYYLEGDIQDLEIRIHDEFQPYYVYNESIFGSWQVNNVINFTFWVEYTIWGQKPFMCHNTSIESFLNKTAIITAFLPPQNWNSSISIQLKALYFTDLILSSATQNFTIIDPHEPYFEFSVLDSDESIQICIFIDEPELSSGVKNVSLIYDDYINTIKQKFENYYEFEVEKKHIHSNLIEIIAFDKAGNKHTSGLLDISGFISLSKPFFSLFNSQLLMPTIFSSLLIGGIIIIRMIRKWKSTII